MRVEEVPLDHPQDHEVLQNLAADETFCSDLRFIEGDTHVPTPKMHSFRYDLPPSVLPGSADHGG